MPDEKIAAPIIAQFKRLIKRYYLTQIGFTLAIITESILLVFFFPILFKSALFAITLALLLITIFSYFTLRNYQLSEKEDAFKDLAQKYVRGVLSLSPGLNPADTKKKGAFSCEELADSALLPTEPSLNRLPRILRKGIKKLFPEQMDSNVLFFKEILYKQAIEELAGQIRLFPCEIEPHRALVKILYKLQSLYKDLSYKSLARDALLRAAEELKIIADLSVSDPYHCSLVLGELAECYKELGETSLEIEALEKGRSFDPQNQEILFRLGQLYFSQKEAAKGFKIYEILKDCDLAKSDRLMSYYN